MLQQLSRVASVEPVYDSHWACGLQATILCRTCRHVKYPVRFSPECSASQCHLGPQDSSTFKRINAFLGTIRIIEQTLFSISIFISVLGECWLL